MNRILVVILGIAIIQPIFAQEASCDQLAASPLDPQKITPGVSYEKLNAAQAVSACKLAVEANPRAGRLWFQYGRALEKANRLPDAITAYQEAAKLNSGAAYNNLGEMYRDGKGFQKDPKKAEEYFSKSAELSSPEGRSNLAGLQKKSGDSIPASFRGGWSDSRANCKTNAVMVNESTIYSPYNETICLLKEISEHSAAVLTGKFFCKTAVAADVPYPKATKNIRLQISADGKLSSSSFENENRPLVHCN